MRSPKSVASQIATVEGFEVRFVLIDGGEPERRRIDDYPYERAAQETWTVAHWRSHRIVSNYPDFTVEALDTTGKAVHGKTLLSSLRNQWAEVGADDESEEPVTQAEVAESEAPASRAA